MEVNARHNLSTALAVHCGINFPCLEYSHRTGKGTAPVEGFARDIYWIDLCRDVGFSLRHRKQEKYSWRQLLKPYWSPHVFAILDRKDPMPIIRRVGFLASSGVRAAMAAAWRWCRPGMTGPGRSSRSPGLGGPDIAFARRRERPGWGAALVGRSGRSRPARSDQLHRAGTAAGSSRSWRHET
jgi:hypothetical protein